jgi:hypothetical protein
MGAGKTKTGRLWVYVRDERGHGGARPPAAIYYYSPDRKGEHPVAHLDRFAGHLHADGYAGFNALYAPTRTEVPAKVQEVACMAHVRQQLPPSRARLYARSLHFTVLKGKRAACHQISARPSAKTNQSP